MFFLNTGSNILTPRFCDIFCFHCSILLVARKLFRVFTIHFSGVGIGPKRVIRVAIIK